MEKEKGAKLEEGEKRIGRVRGRINTCMWPNQSIRR